MKARLAAVVGVLLTLAVLGVAYLVRLVGSFDTPEFQRSLLARASSAVGTRVQARKVHLSLLEGVTLEKVSVANPPPFAGDLVTADAFVLRYSLWSLLSGRLEMTRLALDKPALTLAMDARGLFNYEKLGASGAPSSAPGATALPIELVVSKLSLTGARIVVRDTRSALARVEGADLDTSIRFSGALAEGKGTLRIAQVSLADTFFVRGVSTPLRASKGVVLLSPVRGSLAAGAIEGDARVQFQNGFFFSANLKLKGAQLQKLLQEAKATQAASGTLMADATVEGSGGTATLRGKGQAQVKDCKVAQAPVMSVLATALGIPDLAHPEFDECRMTFTLGEGRFVTPSLSLKARSLQLTGHGVTRLDTLSVDYDMTMALSKTLLERIPARELRAAFKDRGDGFATLEFKVTGTTTAPHTDLALRLGKAAAGEAAESGLKKLFKGKIF